MKVSELLADRQRNWAALHSMCSLMERRAGKKLGAGGIARFAALYRSACADLALADSYNLPPNTTRYLHQLVGRAHNQLYRSRKFRFSQWGKTMLRDTPRRLFRDVYLRTTFVLFFGLGILSFFLARDFEWFAEAAIGRGMMESMELMYSTQQDRSFAENSSMFGFYVHHNAGIGIKCFAAGLLFCGFGGVFAVMFNACLLGSVFGYMQTTPMAGNFNTFVTAHGPFELFAIVLSGAAGMRIGFAYIFSRGQTRGASLRRAGREALPIICAAILLFVLAAFVEGFISPMPNIAYAVKAAVALLSSAIILFYVIGLGWPPEDESALAEEMDTLAA